MSNPKPLAEAELPELPEWTARSRHPHHGCWCLADWRDTETYTLRDVDRLRAMSSWIELANGLEPQKSEAEIARVREDVTTLLCQEDCFSPELRDRILDVFKGIAP